MQHRKLYLTWRRGPRTTSRTQTLIVCLFINTLLFMDQMYLIEAYPLVDLATHFPFLILTFPFTREFTWNPRPLQATPASIGPQTPGPTTTFLQTLTQRPNYFVMMSVQRRSKAFYQTKADCQNTQLRLASHPKAILRSAQILKGYSNILQGHPRPWRPQVRQTPQIQLAWSATLLLTRPRQASI